MSELRQFALAAYFFCNSPVSFGRLSLCTANIGLFSESTKCLGVEPDGGGNGGEPPYLISQKVA